MGKLLDRFVRWFWGFPSDVGFCPRCETVDVMISTHLCLPERSLPGGDLTANDWGE